MVDSNTEDQLKYEEAIMEIRNAVRELRAQGTDFSKKAVRKAFTDNIIQTTKKVVHDKRIWD